MTKVLEMYKYQISSLKHIFEKLQWGKKMKHYFFILYYSLFICTSVQTSK